MKIKSQMHPSYSARWQDAIQDNYGHPALTLVSGKGCTLTDSEGATYLDLLGGIATNVLGHSHPAIVKAVSEQIKKLGHVSNFYSHPGVISLAEKLQDLTGDPSARVFFCNSGAEANEAALKLSRRTGRKKIIATQGAFHGRTMGALSLTGQVEKRKAFLPLLPDVLHLPFGDSRAMVKKITRRTAMVIVEPILGEAGVVVPPVGYLRSIREACNETGTLMVVDAVQTGMGRTGQWFGYEYEGIKPDVITLAKGLGGGLPLGAMIALGSANRLFQAGDHGSTFGGNPIACASALAVIDEIEKENLLAKVAAHGEKIKAAISQIKGVSTVRGQGLLLGIVLEGEWAVAVKEALQGAGVLVNAPTSAVIRIAPALNISESEIDQFIEIFMRVMEGHSHG